MGNSLSSITTNAASLSALILVSPQSVIGYQPQNPLNSTGPQNSDPYTKPALLFHYEGEQTATFTSDITDHYIENNTSVQDQIALKPVIITTQGFIGDLNDVPPIQALATIQQALQSSLTVLSAYTPALSVTALNAYNEALFLYQTAATVANSAVSTWSALSGTGGESVITGTSLDAQKNQSKQQSYFQQFFGYWANRTLFTVQTPWAVFQNMAIQSVRAIQEADTNVITDFEVTFKQMNFASTESNVLSTDQAYLISGGRTYNQSLPDVNNGTGSLSSDTSFSLDPNANPSSIG